MFANEMGILGVNLDKTNLDNDNNFMKTIMILLFMSNFLLGVINLKNSEYLKKR